ncbi:MAG: FAD-binding oxidoreductase [Halodesulfurarchaeum sp.]
MVSVREHTAQHDDPEELPLLTESAEVAEITALDEDRTDEVHEAAERLLLELGEEEFVLEDGHPPTIDWDGVETVLEENDGPIVDRLSTVADRYHRAYPSLLSIRLEEVDPEDSIGFLPGQYLTLQFQDTPRPYSVASSPNWSYLEFCIRRVPGGRLTSDLFSDLESGDEVVLRGPNGDFVLEEPSDRDVAFLATGTGVAPLRSMIQYIFEEGMDVHGGESRDVWLFLGASWKDDLAYREEFEELAAEHDNFHFVPTLSRETYLTDWDGETDYVQHTVMKYLESPGDYDLDGKLGRALEADPETDIEARLDPSTLEVYACGVTAMVSTLVDAVEKIGVPEEHIQGEGYG